MSDLSSLGRALIIAGVLLALVGLLVLAGPKIPWLGRLPGDLAIRREGFSVYVPITSSILISLVLSAVLWVVGQWRR